MPVPGAGCLMPGAWCRLPGAVAWCLVPVAGCQVPGAGCRVPGAGCLVPGMLAVWRASVFIEMTLRSQSQVPQAQNAYQCQKTQPIGQILLYVDFLANSVVTSCRSNLSGRREDPN